MEIIRALVRPVVAGSVVGTIVYLAVSLVNRFATVDMATQILTFVLATGATVVGFYFGERASKSR